MPIVPDVKNWTWVLERRCDECSFDASLIRYDEIPELLRKNANAWPAVLGRSDVRLRPNESTWSALEYAAHVRDVFRLFPQRLALILANDGPTFANWDQDETAESERYNEQDPAIVGEQLIDAGEAAALAFGAVAPEDRTRAGYRSDGAVFTVEALARYFVHDPIHHLHDVSG